LTVFSNWALGYHPDPMLESRPNVGKHGAHGHKHRLSLSRHINIEDYSKGV